MKVCMVAYAFYETDNRVRRYAEALAKRGDTVEAISLRREGLPAFEILNGVRVHRVQPRQINEKGKLTHITRLIGFFLRSMAFLTRSHLKERYDLIHVHSVPDFEVFAALFAKLGGAKVILDIHDIMPEFYVSKFNSTSDSLAFKVLLTIERLSTRFADHVIAANHIWGDRLVDRAVPDSKCTTFLNYPDSSLFQQKSGVQRNDGKFVMLYPGTLNYHQGLDLAVRAFSQIKDQIPEAEFHIYGAGEQLEYLGSLIGELNLQDRVFLKGIVPLEQVSSVIAGADLGVVPKRSNAFGDEAFSTKTLEFMTVGVPLIVPNTTIDSYYFDDSLVTFFKANDETSLAEAMLRMAKNPELRRHQVENSLEFVKKFTWDTNRAGYLDLVDFLVNGKPRISFPSGKPAHQPAKSPYCGTENGNGNGNASRNSNGHGLSSGSSSEESDFNSKHSATPRTKSGTLTL
ncbi:MAG TPA: glycosyltransferase family 4 protein [Candidatus Acidoferrum sp.]|jgi:glycosyltransferase involved in cell wall biosynthesis